MIARPGVVYLVGAGPGDPGLITRRGLELLRSCDVVLYDRLVAPELLDEVPRDSERIFVGKKPGEIHSRQVVADALLVSRARAGKSVVRLKGGDPFVFGRGSEEARLLAGSGIPFEIVPGVSSAIAAPAYAGIPVTERGTASSFAVLAGRAEGDGERDWSAIATAVDTLVLLMGVDALEDVAARLIAGGRKPDEPAAVVQWGTTVRQKTVRSTLAQVAHDARAAGIAPPAIAVIGAVAATEDLGWFEDRPLLGRRVVVTRPAEQSGALIEGLNAAGAEVVRFPVIALTDPPSFAELDAALGALAGGTYDWILFTSVNAVAKTLGRLAPLGRDTRVFAPARIAAVGPATVAALARARLRADLVPDVASGRDVAAALGTGRGSILWPRVGDAPTEVPTLLRAAGWDVHEVTAYVNLPATPEKLALEQVRAGAYDAVTFTSASTVRNFIALAGLPAAGSIVACIGPETAAAATGADIDVAIVAETHTSQGLAHAVIAALSGSS